MQKIINKINNEKIQDFISKPTIKNKQELKSELKLKSESESKLKSESEPKSESKSETKLESKLETKSESKSESKLESKLETKLKSESKSETKSETNIKEIEESTKEKFTEIDLDKIREKILLDLKSLENKRQCNIDLFIKEMPILFENKITVEIWFSFIYYINNYLIKDDKDLDLLINKLKREKIITESFLPKKNRYGMLEILKSVYITGGNSNIYYKKYYKKYLKYKTKYLQYKMLMK